MKKRFQPHKILPITKVGAGTNFDLATVDYTPEAKKQRD